MVGEGVDVEVGVEGRGTGRGRGRGSGVPHDGLTEREKKVLKGQWQKREN